MPASRKLLVLLLIVASLALLVPGVTQPMLTLTGTLEKAQVADTATAFIVDSMAARTLERDPEVTEEEARAKAEASVAQVLAMIGMQAPEGELEAYRKTRSILGTVKELVDSGNALVGFLVVLFSVIIPTFKIGLLLVASFAPPGRLAAGSLGLSRAISKWSMADVFVVAIIVAFLAANASVDLDELVKLRAEFEIGFWLFLGYCLFSVASSQLVENLDDGGTGVTPAAAGTEAGTGA